MERCVPWARDALLDMEAILSLLIPITFVLMLVLERVFPGRPLPKVRFWALKGGNPLFVVECARSFKSSGTLGSLPPTVRQVVLERFAVLPDADPHGAHLRRRPRA